MKIVYLILTCFGIGNCVILIHTNNTGNKDAYKYPDNILDYHTSLSRYGFKMDNSVTFLIKACNNAFVSLCRSKQMSSKENYYEIAFGSDHNFKLRVRRLHQQVESYKLMHAGVLDCNEYKAFWISWINGSISIGKGVDRCQNEVLSWHDPNSFSIKSIGVMTGYGSTGEWLVLSNTEVSSHDCGCKNSDVSLSTNNILNMLKERTSVDELKSAISIKKKTLSSAKRKMTSARDKRFSSACIGITGCLIIVSGIILILILDCVPSRRRHK